MAILAFMDSYILKRVLSIVTFSRRIVEILGPNQNSVSSWRRKNLNILSFWTSNIEFRSLKSTVEIVNVNKAIVFRIRHQFSILPSHEVVWRARRTFGFWCSWTEQITIELAVIHSIVFLNLTINFWQRR